MALRTRPARHDRLQFVVTALWLLGLVLAWVFMLELKWLDWRLQLPRMGH